MTSTLLVDVDKKLKKLLQPLQTDLPGYNGVVGQVLASDLIKGPGSKSLLFPHARRVTGWI